MKQWWNGSSIFRLKFAETMEVPNTVSDDISQLSDDLPNGSKRLAICELQQSESRPVAESAFLAYHTFLYKTGFWKFFAVTCLETPYTKNITHELSFRMVTHMTHFDIRFRRYGCFKSGYGAELILDRLM
jgi:hypothetical protein